MSHESNDDILNKLETEPGSDVSDVEKLSWNNAPMEWETAPSPYEQERMIVEPSEVTYETSPLRTEDNTQENIKQEIQAIFEREGEKNEVAPYVDSLVDTKESATNITRESEKDLQEPHGHVDTEKLVSNFPETERPQVKHLVEKEGGFFQGFLHKVVGSLPDAKRRNAYAGLLFAGLSIGAGVSPKEAEAAGHISAGVVAESSALNSRAKSNDGEKITKETMKTAETKTFSAQFVEDKLRALLESDKSIKEITSLEVTGAGKEITVNFNIVARPLGSAVGVQAILESRGGKIEIKNYTVDASWMVKAKAESSIAQKLNGVSGLLKSYIERESGEKVKNMEIVNGKIVSSMVVG